jgi:ABC-type uncharacterized transport system involved in gliding motility auxiliary subunit
VDYNPGNIAADLAHATDVQTSRNGTVSSMPSWLSLDHDSVNTASPVTAQLDRFLFIEAGSFTVAPAPGLTVTPLLETSDRSGDLATAMLDLTPPDQMGRDLKLTGKHTLAALLQGKLRTAFPVGPPKDEKADDKKDAAAPPPAVTAPALKESSGTSNLLIVADTDWLFDQYIFDPELRQAGLLKPTNHNLDLAASSLDFLTGSPELLSVRGKGASIRPFAVVQAMKAEAGKKFQDQLSTLEARLNEVQSKLSGLQARRTDGGRLVATPEMQAEIERFKKDQREITHEQREISRRLREDVDALGRRLLWANLLATPLLVGAFGLWFARARRRG